MPSAFTFKTGRYPGRGEDLMLANVGEHAASGNGMGVFPGHPWAAYRRLHGFAASCSYTAADCTERKTGTGSAIAMVAGGLQLTSGSDAATDDAQTQWLRSYTPAANGFALCFCRVQIDDIANPGFVFGFANTVTDWFNAEATNSAAFLMAKGGATVVGRSKDGATGSSTATLLTAVAATQYDLYVHLLGTSAIEFGYKVSTTPTWTKTRKITNLPTAALRFTMGIESGTTANKNLLFERWGYWASLSGGQL